MVWWLGILGLPYREKHVVVNNNKIENHIKSLWDIPGTSKHGAPTQQLIAAAFGFHELGTCTGRASGAGAVLQTWIPNCWVKHWGVQPLENHGTREIHWRLRFFLEMQGCAVQNCGSCSFDLRPILGLILMPCASLGGSEDFCALQTLRPLMQNRGIGIGSSPIGSDCLSIYLSIYLSI